MDFNQLAIQAMQRGKRLKLVYHPTNINEDEHRTVEVHAVGVSPKGSPCMRVFQTGGSSVYSEKTGWKMLSFKDVDDVQITDEESLAPRPGYNPGDRGMSSVTAEVSNEPVPIIETPDQPA